MSQNAESPETVQGSETETTTRAENKENPNSYIRGWKTGFVTLPLHPQITLKVCSELTE